jgi:cell division protein FtsB
VGFPMKIEAPQSFFRRNVRYFVALAFFLLLLQDMFGTHGLLAMHRSKDKIVQVQVQNRKLNQENQELSQEIQRLRTDPSSIEKIARDRMGLARPGELIFRMPDTKQNGQAAPQPHTSPQKSQGLPKQQN